MAFYINRIIACLTGRIHTVKIAPNESGSLSIIQGSGIGPTRYVISESDLESKSLFNIIFRYANDN